MYNYYDKLKDFVGSILYLHDYVTRDFGSEIFVNQKISCVSNEKLSLRLNLEIYSLSYPINKNYYRICIFMKA